MPSTRMSLTDVPSAPAVLDPAAPATSVGPTRRRTGRREFVAVTGLITGLGAMSIDTLLPAFPEIREHLSLGPDSARVSLLVSAFLLGMGLGQLPFGVFADRYGRRRILYLSLVLFSIGAVAATLSPTLPVMVAARFLWGLGAAGPRTVAMAMVRDSFEGVEMATVLSYVQSIFVIVPVFAPALGVLALRVGGWRAAMLLPLLLAGVVAAWMLRISETLPVVRRRVISTPMIAGAFREIGRSRSTVSYALAMIFMFSCISSYIAVSELIMKDTYDRAEQFPVIFGAIAAVMGGSTLVNARLVRRLGLDTMLRFGPAALAGGGLTFAAVNFATDGRPPFLVFCVGMAVILGLLTLVMPNCNTAAMGPLGHLAGLAAGLLGTMSTVGGAILGGIVSQLPFAGTTGLAIGIAVFTCGAFIAVRVARSSPHVRPLS